ncbi:MAG: 1-deoxy-D-xylulose-5-phosphate synthase [Lachnospiraceae bacterium]|nr:1-deoxy-D-xylulose-5-phosphate synthase [Lachnospiraceae bacterium]
MYLEQINKVNDIKTIDKKNYEALAQEIRDFLIEKISVNGGHLGSNLGAVELTMALHLTLDLPEDKIIWDVGHQSYTHKLLTGRRDGFDTLRKKDGMSGFPKRKESECDSFDTGHSSTSISAGLGLVKARELTGGTNTIVSVIGDGSLTGGMAYEALNNASRLDTNFIIVLNDNNMSISENVGGVSKYLNTIRTADGYISLRDGIYNAMLSKRYGDAVIGAVRKTKNVFKQMVIPGMFFEDMGLTYLGPVDGHDIHAVCKVLKEAKRCNKAVLVHVITEKGRGFEPAIRHPARFHGAEPFEIETGLPRNKKAKANYTDVFATVMMKMGARNDKVVAITAAMPDGTGLKRFHNVYPDRFFDVGIAEEHAVTFAAGLAVGGLIPIVAIYSSFLQRAYDQILHDVCIQNLHVVFAIDRAGLVGSDGETHQGIFDLSYLASIPNMHVMAPKNKWELSDMMKFAVDTDVPIAIRYPRGQAYDGLRDKREPIVMGKSEVLFKGEDIAIIAVGSMVKIGVDVVNRFHNGGKDITLINARFVKPIDEELISELADQYKLIVTMEENVLTGGYGERVVDFLASNDKNVKVLKIGIPDRFVEHGNVDALLKELQMDAAGAYSRIVNEYSNLRDQIESV